MSYKITNVKISLKIKEKSLDSVQKICEREGINFKRYLNFLIIRDIYIFTIFKTGKSNQNHVNITKIPNLLNVEKSINQLTEKYNISVIENNYIVDNITGSLDLKKEIILKNFIKTVDKINDKHFSFQISYNNSIFPGLYLKVQKNSKKIGSIGIFFSGKVNIVGCKNIDDLECLSTLITALTKMN